MRKKQKQEAPPPVTVRQFYSTKEKTLSCSHQETLMNLTGTNKLKNVQKMIVQNCPNIRSFKGCDQLESVKYIDFSGSPIENTDALSNYRKLQQFICQNCCLENIDGLSQNFALQILDLRGNQLQSFDSIETIKNFKCLKELWLKDNPVEEVEGYKDYLASILPISLQKFNGEPLDQDLQQQIRQKNQAKNPIMFKRPATASRASRYQNRFLEEIKAYQRQNEGNVQYIGYLSKRVNYVTTIPGANCSYTTEMLDMTPDELLICFKTRPLVINDEKLFLADYDGRSTYKLQNKANFFVQIAYVMTSALASKEALIVGQLTKQKPINTYELQTRLLDLYDTCGQLQIGPGTLGFRRRENDYETHVIVFLRAAPPVDEAALLPESPLSLLRDFGSLQVALRTISVGTSFDLVLEDFSDEILQSQAYSEWNILDERDAEARQRFDFNGRLNAVVVRRGEILFEGQFAELKEFLKDDLGVKEDELDLELFRLDEERRGGDEYSKDYTYEYSYVDEELPEPDAKQPEQLTQPEVADGTTIAEDGEPKDDEEAPEVEKKDEEAPERFAYAD